MRGNGPCSIGIATDTSRRFDADDIVQRIDFVDNEVGLLYGAAAVGRAVFTTPIACEMFADNYVLIAGQ
ncbi:hypothetical protein EVAR_27964_1 [Eumeta japonica]|uniref:Uncharacterized protein n=1 Tax=Eumeta variegata TaxID=151549 RepID=A0A4C1WDR3_EUMVA|nr:hypothetical protein EVAR_27964_1 [Eumeta japonica]